MTVFGSHGRARTDAFSAGDAVVCRSATATLSRTRAAAISKIMALFNNGSYAWMAANPDLLLSTNFGVPESVFAKFPKDAVIVPE